jgi:DNA-binding protein H-NS
MGQPNPPGDIPLIEGLGSEWNEFVSAFPEDKRNELGSKFKERVSEYESLKGWEDFQKSGITPEHAGTALNLYSIIENNPQQVYETIGKALGITPEQAEDIVEEVESGDPDDPRIATMQQQIDTLTQIALAERQMTTQEKQAKEADMAVENDIQNLKKKYGDSFPEDEIIMRMLYKDMDAEAAYKEYSDHAEGIRARRPAPYVMGSGGHVPDRSIDVKSLDNKGTKNLVAQMLEHANQESSK